MSSRRVVIATGNVGKLAEMRSWLAPIGLEAVAQSEFNVPAAAETALTFIENALIKARHAARITGLTAIADDSGLEVDSLSGAPGIYSARYAGGGGDAANNAKLLEALAGVPDAQRQARFQCIVVYLRHAEDPTPLVCQGTWPGFILRAPRGEHGFGYDPLFRPADTLQSAAELPPEEKNRVSHRARAMRQLVERLRRDT